jgi:hypothetical protein
MSKLRLKVSLIFTVCDQTFILDLSTIHSYLGSLFLHFSFSAITSVQLILLMSTTVLKTATNND